MSLADGAVIQQANLYRKWAPVGQPDYPMWRRYAHQLMRMAVLHANWAKKTKTGAQLTPGLEAEFTRLNAELDTVTIAVPAVRSAETRVAQTKAALFELRNDVYAHRLALATNAVPASAVLFDDAVAAKLDAITNTLLPATDRLRQELTDFYAIVDPGRVFNGPQRVRGWMRTLREEDFEALAELVNADDAPGFAAGAVVNATPRQFLGNAHRSRASMRDWTLHEYIFQLVGLDIRNPAALSVDISGANFDLLRPQYVRIGRAAAAVLNEAGARRRTLQEVLDDVLRAVATVDNFATIDAAVKNLFDILRVGSADFARWRVIAAAGEAIMELYFNYTAATTAPNARVKVQFLRQQAEAIYGLFNQ